jgi:hypothetical protein
VQAYRSVETGPGWDAWRAHLAGRPLPAIGRLLAAKGLPLAWGLPRGDEYTSGLRLAETLTALERRARLPAQVNQPLERLLADANTNLSTAGSAVEALAWSRALVPLSAHLDERSWWRLLLHLSEIASTCHSACDSLLVEQWLAGELPLTLAYQFPELANGRAMAISARRTNSTIIERVLVDDGIVRGRYLPWLSPLVASWIRCHAIGSHMPGGWCDGQAARQLPRAVDHALRFLRFDRTPMLSSPAAVAWSPDFLRAAARTASRRLASTRRGLRGQRRLRRGKPAGVPAMESETAGVALLRTAWSQQSPRLAVVYGERPFTLELCAGASRLWSGAWDVEVRFNGETLDPIGAWEQTCWISDDSVDYLELQLKLSGEVTVERHMILVHQHEALILADAVMGIGHGALEYRGRLPLAGCSRFEGEGETWEGFLVAGGKRRARVLPLALNEWRASPARGNLLARGDALELVQDADGQCLFAPLFFDLKPARLARETTWRQLTVAEDRQIVPADVAVGYRVQSGRSQWLLYRSLAPPAVRSVLGKNLLHELLVGEVCRGGQVETLVEIDST